MRAIVAALALTSLAACSKIGAEPGGSVSLYRNSPINLQMRVHLATFDAPDGFNLNYGNCTQASRLLNASVDAFAATEHKPRNSKVGFWCEAVENSEKGNVPTSFVSEFPSLGETLPNEGTPLRW